MDDMRHRYKTPRRDFTKPAGRPASRPPSPSIIRPPFKPSQDLAPDIPDALKHAYQPPPSQVPNTLPPSAPIFSRHQNSSASGQAAIQRPATHYNHRPKRHLLRNTTLALILLATLAASGLYAYPRYIYHNPFPSDIRGQVNFSLLYPNKLPAGYSIAPSSFQVTNGVVIYFADNGQNRLVFTIQKLPLGFNFDSFYKQGLNGANTFQTDVGEAAVGTANGRLVGSLKTGQSWLLINADAGRQPPDLSIILKNMKLAAG